MRNERRETLEAMTVSLARRLTWEGVVAPEEANLALYKHVTERVSFLQGLVERHPELAEQLETELGAVIDPSMQLVAEPELLEALPPGLAVALAALPLYRDPASSVVYVVAAHAADAHVASEMSYHLGAPVEVTAAPLRSILEALPREHGGNGARHYTPAFGTKMPPSPSERPIPLVRVSTEPAAPSTARHGSMIPEPPAALAVASRAIAGESLAPIRPNSIIPLTSTRPLGSQATPTVPSPMAHSESTAPPITAPLMTPAVAVETDQGHALEDLAQALTVEEVTSALIRGLETVARRVVVLAARGKSFDGRASNDPAQRDTVRLLAIPADRPSILLTAVQGMGYVGPVPSTPIHGALLDILGNPGEEVAVGAVIVSGRPALLYVCAGLVTTYLATRRGDQLAEAAGKALARIVRDRKR
jgi:hypothetical protein